MPRIPISKQPGLIQQQRSTVHASGAPGMNWKMEEGAALRQLGDSIGISGAQVGGALQKYANEAKETQNTLAATQAGNLYRSINTDLENRMAENPNEFDNFKDWATEAEKRYEDESKDFVGRMSPEFRAQFVERMNGIRAEALGRRVRIGIQAKVTADYNLFQSEFKNAAITGDEETARFLLDRERGRLISDQEYQMKLMDFERLRDAGAAKRLVDAGDDGIIESLKKRDDAGNFTEFSKMDTAYRDRLIRVAESNDAQRRSDENQMLLDRLNSGELVLPEDIDRAFADKTSPEAVKQKNQQKKIVSAFLRHQETAAKQAAREERADQREERKATLDNHEYKLLTYEFAADPAKRMKQYAELRNEILTRYAGDGPAVKRLIGQLDENLKSVTKPDSSYKKTYTYIRGKNKLDDMKGDFYSRYPGRGESWYSWFTNVYNDTDVVKTDNLAMAKLQYDAFIKANPQATTQDVDMFLEKLKKDVNRVETDKLMQFWQSYSVPNLGRTGALSQELDEIERVVKGRIAVFGRDKKFKRWKDEK